MPCSSSFAIFRCAGAEMCKQAAVSRFRQDGVIIVDNFIGEPMLQNLSRACASAAQQRGTQVFPAFDPEHSGALQFDMKVKPRATAKLSELPPPEDLKKVMQDNDAKRALDRHVRRIDLQCKNQRKVDRLYRQLTKRRNRFHQQKQIPTVITEEEELSGDISEERMKEIEQQFSYEQVKRSFEQYRDDGRMELEIRRENHIDDTLQFLENWGRYWIGFWCGLPSDVRSTVGSTVGQAATSLGGEVAVRLYSDTLQEFFPFTNGMPFHCVAPGLNFCHPNAMTACLRLAPTSTGGRHEGAGDHAENADGKEEEEEVWTRQVVVPGSHRAILSITRDGKDFTGLPNHQVLDAGYLMRHTPALRGLPVVEVPRLPPGSALLLSAYLVQAFLPTLVGRTTVPYQFPTRRLSRSPHFYQLAIMPDRCTFDGQRNSWFSKDTHGPLYAYQKGDALVDDSVFPMLYRALDVE